MHKTVEKGRHMLITNKCSSNFTKHLFDSILGTILGPILKKYRFDTSKENPTRKVFIINTKYKRSENAALYLPEYHAGLN